jgi:hypothetical protein
VQKWIAEQHDIDTDGWCSTCRKTTDGKCNKALPNPPNIEAVERKKLEDEIALLDGMYFLDGVSKDLDSMIAERKAQLEKMK